MWPFTNSRNLLMLVLVKGVSSTAQPMRGDHTVTASRSMALNSGALIFNLWSR
jgi:hypothetical protein